mgnify:FL=1
MNKFNIITILSILLNGCFNSDIMVETNPDLIGDWFLTSETTN